MVPFNDFVASQRSAMDAFLDRVIAYPAAQLDATPPLATRPQALERDLPALHWFLANNLQPLIKSLCDYKQFDVVRDLAVALSQCGLPPASKPTSLQ